MSDRDIYPGQYYRHSKSGKDYQVIGTGIHTETEEAVIVYRPLYPSEHQLFVRPIRMFTEEVAIDGVKRARFEKVSPYVNQ